jgi:hypothetical protein
VKRDKTDFSQPATVCPLWRTAPRSPGRVLNPLSRSDTQRREPLNLFRDPVPAGQPRAARRRSILIADPGTRLPLTAHTSQLAPSTARKEGNTP